MTFQTEPRVVAIALVALAAIGHAAEHDPPDGRDWVVGKIEIVTLDVFDETEETTFVHRTLNAFHHVTRDYVIARELLFAEGDAYDPALCAETERNLRALAYIAEASVEPRFRNDGKVDIRVVTRDRFTLRLSAGGSFQGGSGEADARIGESNLLGLGLTLKSTYERSEDDEVLRVKTRDPNFFGTRHEVDTTFSHSSSFGEHVELLVLRPFYALDVEWAWGTSGTYEKSEEDYFANGDEVSRIPLETASLGGFVARAFGDREQFFTIEVGVEAEERTFGLVDGPFDSRVPLPIGRRAVGVALRPSVAWRPKYIEAQHLDTLDGIEDLALGVEVHLQGGVAYWDADRDTGPRYPLRAGGSALAQPGEAHFISTVIDGGLRVADGLERRAFDLVTFARYYLTALPRQTLVFGASFDMGRDDENLPVQLTLSEENGLRGYASRAFEGDQRLLLNVEDRVFTDLEVLSLHLGGAAFFDAGYVWDRFERVDLDRLKESVGGGLRVGSRRLLGGSIIRVDVAFPLDADGFEVSVSFTQGQALTLLGLPPDDDEKF